MVSSILIDLDPFNWFRMFRHMYTFWVIIFNTINKYPYFVILNSTNYIYFFFCIILILRVNVIQVLLYEKKENILKNYIFD